MAEGATDAATLDAYATAQARLEHAGGYDWREGVNATLHGLGFRDERPRPLARDVLRRRADARLAGPRAGRRPRPAAARRADQPPRHRVARVARDAPADARRRRRARRPRPLVPGGGRHRRCSSSRPAARGSSRAPGTPGARRRRRASSRSAARSRRQQAEIDAARALRRPLPRRHPRAPGAVARQAAGQDRAHRARPARRQVARLRVQAAGALRPRRVRDGGRASCGSATATLLRDAELWLERGEHVSLVGPNGSGKTTLISALDRPARARRRQAAARPQRQARRCSPSTPRSSARPRTVLEAAQRATGAHAEQGARAARPVPVLRRGGREAGRRALRRRAPAAVAGDPRPLRRQRPDPRRADQPPRPREPRGARGGAPGASRARCC